MEVSILRDAIFYLDKYGKSNVLHGYKNIEHLPVVNDFVMFGTDRYMVKERIFDFSKNVVHILLKKV